MLAPQTRLWALDPDVDDMNRGCGQGRERDGLPDDRAASRMARAVDFKHEETPRRAKDRFAVTPR
jgi:hypothetical protein